MRNKKDIWRLEEHLIPATLDRIDLEISKREGELDVMLNKPIKDLSSKYLNLLDNDTLDQYLDKTLYDIIKETILTSSNAICFCSETIDDWLEGFAYYNVSMRGNIVTNIGIFSFSEDVSSFTLARDIVRLLNELTEKYQLIRFSCTKNQPLLERYILETDKRNGFWDYDDDEELYYFEIPGKKMLEQITNHGYLYNHGEIEKCQ